MARRYWLFKSEPTAFSIADLKASPQHTTGWDGVRNYQARNLLRDEVQTGDRVFFYHSNAKPPAVVGIARVVRTGYPDTSGKKGKMVDGDGNPVWVQVDIQYEREIDPPISLDELKEIDGLQDMVLLNRSRLSVQPVTAAEWKIINGLHSKARGRK